MKIYDFIQSTAKKLSVLYDDNHAKTVAWWLLEKVTGKSKAQLLASQESINNEQIIIIDTYSKELIIEHKPLQYILGSVDFGPLKLSVVPPILIPRPETEEWVFALIDKLKSLKKEKLTILDMCTGTGAIGLLLAYELPYAQVYAVDIAENALQLAQHNMHINKITNITFIKSDLFDALSKDIKFDLIVSNPPYIADVEWCTLAPQVKNWEDKRALVAENNGLLLIEKIIKNSHNFLKKDSILLQHNLMQLVIEIGHKQGDVVKKLFKTYNYNNVIILKDYNDKDRLVAGF